MEEIKIIFFILGTLFGLEHDHIAADKTTVTISPETKTIAIQQEGLFAMIKTKEDSRILFLYGFSQREPAHRRWPA